MQDMMTTDKIVGMNKRRRRPIVLRTT